MTSRRPVTLLGFAIGASVAVVPVLLAVLLIVAWLRPLAAESEPRRDADRHVSARQVAALKTFEEAIVRRDSIATRVGDADALLAAVPACRAEWAPKAGVVRRVRQWFNGGIDPTVPAADRIAVQLAALDAALLRFSTADNRRVSGAVGVDLARWTTAVQRTLREPVTSADYPGRTFTVQCADIAGALGALTRGNARMLGVLSWRGTEVSRVVARWRPDQVVEISARSVARANPWSGLPGCIHFAAGDDAAVPAVIVAETRGLAQRVCASAPGAGEDGGVAAAIVVGEPVPGMAPDDARWQVPPSLPALLRSLEPLHRATAARPEPNRVRVDRVLIDTGYAIDVTIVPGVQALAQRVAACYTGRQDVCSAVGIVRKEDDGQPIGHRLLEGAMVRMAAVAIVDVASGRIEALAGAMSPCTREEFDGPGRSRECDARMPYPIRFRPDSLLNPAVFHDAMPASVIKPVMAAAFLSDPDVGPRWLAAERAEMQRTPWPTRDSLRGQLMRSDSARFLDRMFCADRKFADCQRPWQVQAVASDFGWNDGCVTARDDCGKRDLLFSGVPPASAASTLADAFLMRVPYGRLMTETGSDEPGAPQRVRRPFSFDAGQVAKCAAGPDGRRMTKDDWEKCRARTVVDMASEGWGQGNARVSALGVAGMMATLAGVANGDVPRSPHLVDSVRSATTTWMTRDVAPPAGTGGLTRDVAEVILSGLSYSHRAGTARLACEQVFPAKTCRDIDWIAGKTGTPTFPNDDVTLDQLARMCVPGAEKTRAQFAACGALRPYKWYVAAYRTTADDVRWTKAIAVLTERNWLAAGGRIHSAGDHGPNPAAEIAMQIAGRDAGYLKDPVP